MNERPHAGIPRTGPGSTVGSQTILLMLVLSLLEHFLFLRDELLRVGRGKMAWTSVSTWAKCKAGSSPGHLTPCLQCGPFLFSLWLLHNNSLHAVSHAGE